MEFTTEKDSMLNSFIDDDKQNFLDFDEKVEVLLTEQGTKSALKEVAYENPFSTSVGQGIVSVAESFWARKTREGRWRNKVIQAWAFTAGALRLSGSLLAPTAGHVLYLSDIFVNTDIDAQLMVYIKTGVADAEDIYISKITNKNQDIKRIFNGEVYIVPGGYVEIRALSLDGTTTGKAYGTINGVEVALND